TASRSSARRKKNSAPSRSNLASACETASGSIRTASLSRGRANRAIEVFDQVVRVLKAHADSDKAFRDPADPPLLIGQGPVRHRGSRRALARSSTGPPSGGGAS